MSSFRRPLVIKRRYGAPVLDESTGLLMPPSHYTLKVNASVQPMKPNEMQALPEGRRFCRAVKVYSDEQLLMPDQRTGQQSDMFQWLGVWFEVVASDVYCSDVINHFRAYATEVQDH